MERVTKVLVPSAARTVSFTGDAFSGLGNWDRCWVELDVTAAATDASDTLNVYVQTSPDGSSWWDIASFPQVVGNGGAIQHLMKVSTTGDPVPPFWTPGSGTLASGSRRICFTPQRLRCIGTQNDPGAGADSFTYSVSAYLEFDS